ncbi:MAG: response regulator transcription factor [Clostridia bacterium]|nr:response regulator transcription factor [Clostridia bacterium]
MKPILVVDDNEQILEILTKYITTEGWPYLTAKSGEEALALFEAADPTVILLDIMLPGIDGLEVCRRIRKVSKVPIIMITARDEDADRILGLDIGADDYVVKPFSPGEVMARVRAVLRRLPQQEGTEDTLVIGTLMIHLPSLSVTLEGHKLDLTRKEVELLWTLASAPGRVFTRDNLLTLVWGYEHIGSYRAVDSHIKRLRQKLDAHPHTFFSISTVWGTGYKFERNLP